MLLATAFSVSVLFSRSVLAQCSGDVRGLLSVSRFAEARSATERALRNEPASDSLMHCLGEIAYYGGENDAAAGWFERAIAANDRDALHHLWLGKTLAQEVSSVSKLRLPFVARRMRGEFERAVALDGALVGAHEGLMSYYLSAPALFGGSVEMAKKEAAEVVRLNAMRGHIAMGNLFLHEKDFAQAEREFRTATTVALPDSSAAMATLGAFYVTQARWTDAFDVYDRSITAFPSAATFHLQYGRTAALAGQNLERGERELGVWLRESSDGSAPSVRAGAHCRLGTIYQIEGRTALAKAEFEAALAIVPGYADAKRGLQAIDRKR